MPTEQQAAQTTEQLLAATVVASWKQIISRADAFLSALTDEQLDKQIAPNKNRVRYLLGHLTAVHDMLLPSLGIGPRLYPGLDEPYLKNPDRTLPDPLSTADLKAAWSEINTKLTTAFEAFTPAEWLQKHAAVSVEDFAKEPLRNRLAMVLSRTNHTSFHLGQAILTK